jgi:hypothetical protein
MSMIGKSLAHYQITSQIGKGAGAITMSQFLSPLIFAPVGWSWLR